MLITSLLWLIPVCHSTREARKQYDSPHSVNLNGLKTDLSQTSPFDYAYRDELDYNFFPSYDSSDGHDPFYGLDHHGFDNTDDRGGGDYYADYDYYYDEHSNQETSPSAGHLTQEQKDDPFSIFYDSLFSEVDSDIPERSHLSEEPSAPSYSALSRSTTSTTTKPLTGSAVAQSTSQQRYRPLNIPAQFMSKPKIEERKEEAVKDSSTATSSSPKLRPIHIPAHLLTKPKPQIKPQEQNKESERQPTNKNDSDSVPPRLRPLNILADLSEYISLPKPVKAHPIQTQEDISIQNYTKSINTPKPSIGMKKPSKMPIDVLRLKRIMPLVLKQLGLPTSMASEIFKDEDAVNKLVKQLDKMDDFKGLLQHLDLGALASMMSGTDASVAINLLQGSNLASMTGILKSLGIDTSYIDGIFNRIGAAAAPPSTKAEGDDSKFLYLPLLDSGSVSNVQVIGFVVLLLFMLTTAYAYMEYGLLDNLGGTGSSYMGYDTGSFSDDSAYDRLSTGGRPSSQNLGWADSSGLWLPVVESAEADAYYYPGPIPPQDKYIKDFGYVKDYTPIHVDSAEVSYIPKNEPLRPEEESYYQRETQPREPEETYYESQVADEVQYTTKRPYTTRRPYTTKRPSNRYRQRETQPSKPEEKYYESQETDNVRYTTKRPINRYRQRTTTQSSTRPISSSTTWGAKRPIQTKTRTQQRIGGQSIARRPTSTQNRRVHTISNQNPVSTQNRRVYTTSDQNTRQSLNYRRRTPVLHRYNGNRRYSNNREQNYYNPSPPRGYLQLKPAEVSYPKRRTGQNNRRYFDERLSYDEFYQDYDDVNNYDYVSEENYSDYPEYSDYYDDDQTDTVTEGRSNSDKLPYNTMKPNTFNRHVNKVSALSQVRLSKDDNNKSAIVSSTTSSASSNIPPSPSVSSTSPSTSQRTTSTSTTASTTPEDDIRPTSKIISTIKERRRQDTFSDEHSQDWLRFIHKLA